jgi:hypothetical protein
MKDVLELYADAPHEQHPVVCFDDTPRPPIGESRVPVVAKPGRPARLDYEYVRERPGERLLVCRRAPAVAPRGTFHCSVARPAAWLHEAANGHTSATRVCTSRSPPPTQMSSRSGASSSTS